MLLHRLLHALNALLLVALFVYPILHYDELPDRIPQHFDASGAPDAWTEKTPFSVLLTPLIALGCVALCYGSAWFIPRRPDLVNVPGKVPFQQWPPEAQQRAQRAFAAYLYATGTGLLALFLAVTAGTIEAAHTGSQPGYVLAVVLAFLVLSILSTPFLLYFVSTVRPRA